MRSRFRVIVIGLVLASIGVLVGLLVKREAELQKEIRSLELRLANADEKVDTFIIRDSIPVAQVKVVEVDKTDYKKALADKKLINDLRLRVSEVESENRMLLSTRDTVVLHHITDTIVAYSDKWNSFSYDTSSGVLDWEIRDSLVTYVTSEWRHHFLWWRWGRKGYSVSIVNFNPKSRIEYSKYIKIK